MYSGKSSHGGIRGRAYANKPTLEIHAMPTDGTVRSRAKDMYKIGTEVLPMHGTMSVGSDVRTAAQLKPYDKFWYVLTGKPLSKVKGGGYSLDVAKNLKSLRENPRPGVKIEVSPNHRMTQTNNLSMNFDDEFGSFFEKNVNGNGQIPFNSLSDEQIARWNALYGNEYGYIDPITKTMDMYVWKRVPKE